MRFGASPGARPPLIVVRGLYVQAGDYVMAHRGQAAVLRAVLGSSEAQCRDPDREGQSVQLGQRAPFVLFTGLRPGWVWVRVVLTSAAGAVLVDDAVRAWLSPQRRGWPRTSPDAGGGVWVEADGRLRASKP
jgi:hypothetical protein